MACVVDPEVLRQIEEATGVRVLSRCEQELAAWYQAMVAEVLSDRVFTGEERINLANLAHSFGYDAAKAQELHRAAFTFYFKDGLATALARPVGPDQQARDIAALSEQVPLPPAEVVTMVHAAMQSRLEQATEAALEQEGEEEFLAPEKSRAIRALALAMGQDLSRDFAPSPPGWIEGNAVGDSPAVPWSRSRPNWCWVAPRSAIGRAASTWCRTSGSPSAGALAVWRVPAAPFSGSASGPGAIRCSAKPRTRWSSSTAVRPYSHRRG